MEPKEKIVFTFKFLGISIFCLFFSPNITSADLSYEIPYTLGSYREVVCDNPPFDSQIYFGSFKISKGDLSNTLFQSTTIGNGICAGGFVAATSSFGNLDPVNGQLLDGSAGNYYLTLYIDNNYVEPYGYMVFDCPESGVCEPLRLTNFNTLTGQINTNTSWTKANNPYIVDRLSVAGGATLTIEAGVVVKFRNSISFLNINSGSTLNINGTDTEKVYFTSIKDDEIIGDTNLDGNTTSPDKGSWGSLDIKNSGQVNASHLILKYSQSGINNQGGNVNINDSSSSNNKTYSMLQNTGNAVIVNSIFSDSDFGIYQTSGNMSVHNSVIKNNAYWGGLNETGTFDAVDNFWGDATGPYNESLNSTGLGNAVSNNISFTPWLTENPLEVVETCSINCFSNVLFLPGLEASRLYNTREDGSEDQLWEPNSNSDIEDLYLDINGESINSDIYTRDIIKSGQGVQKIYKSFSDMLDQLKSENKIKDWKAFAYDWRQDINDIVNNGTKYQGEILSLTDTLQSLIGPASKNGKVTIVTHSNGGLLAKAFLSKLQDDKNSGINNLIDNVDVLIMVGAPQIGTPAAVPAVMHGYDQDILGGLLMDKIHARELGRNMYGAYGLLPSREYINRASSSPVTFVDNIIPSNITTAMFQTFGSAVDSYSEYKDFIFGAEGRVNPPITQTILPINLSQNLYSKAEILHDEIDNWTPPGTLEVIQIAGWGVSTIASFEYYPKCSSIIPHNLICELDERPRFTLDGDKTVVTPSANYMEGVVDYWVNLKKYNKDSISIFSANHKNILELSPILDLLSNIMNGSNSYDSNYITTEEPESDSNTLQLSIHSPATIDAYDYFGNHTGRVCVEGEDFCYVEEQIPNSTYLEFGEGKYLNLPEDNFSRIEIKGIGTGTFTYESEKVYPNGNSVITAFKDIPVDSNTLAEVTKNSDESLTLALDQDGNGTIDKTIESELGDVTVYDTTPPEIALSFSTLKKEVIFSGIDDSQVNVTHSKVSTKAIDKQGNTSILYYNRYKEGHDKLRLFFNKIVRNGVVITLPNTFVEYSWKVNKKGTLTDLDTKVIIKGEEAYFFNYRKSTNVTTIFKKEGKIFTVVTKRGFVPVSIVTEGNSIKVIY